MPFAGEDDGFIKILRDQTADKVAGDERDALIDELARTNALQNELLGLVSHELRSPLSAIIGLADLLVRGGNIDEEERRLALEEIRDSGRRMEALIENMLGLARAAVEGEPDLEPVLLQRLIPRLVEDHASRFPARAIEVRFDDDLPPVAGNPVYLGQILRNLLDNAEKYADSSEGFEVELLRESTAVRVRVLDRGVELSQDVLDRIFTPFFRSERDALRARGLGLGMTVCQRLVQAQGGDIRATARPGGGLAVSFTLPIADR